MSKQNVEENVREFVYPLPTAFEVTDMLNRIEAAYIMDVSNSSENVDKYVTEAKRAINMGVYSADLCYASTYKQQSEVMKYTQTIRALVDALDMTRAVDPDLASKMEENENNKEGMSDIITNALYDCYDYLNKNGRGPVSLMIVSGSWVEGLYIATHISDDTFDNKEMVRIIMSQKESLDKLSGLWKEYYVAALGSEAGQLVAGLEQLDGVYKTIGENSISIDQMKQVKEQVGALRNALTTAE